LIHRLHRFFEFKATITEEVRSAVADALSPYGIFVEAAQLLEVTIPPEVDEALFSSVRINEY